MELSWKDLNKTLYVHPGWLHKNFQWYHIDAEGMTLWRLAVIISDILMWKKKAHYCEFWNTGDFIVVTNVEKLTWTWNNKWKQKMYHTYSWWKGNVKSIDLDTLFTKDPKKVLWYAVRGMLPKNKLRDQKMKMLKMFLWAEHTYNDLNLIKVS